MNDRFFTTKVLIGAFTLCLFCAMLAAPAYATNSGLDTPTGVTSLPFGIEGAEVMTLTGTGLGIGLTSPQVPLDVSGTVHFINNYNGGFPAYGGTLGSEGGLAIGWNGQSDTHGETDFVNFPGLGSGGFDFVLANSGGSAASIPVTILGSGNVGIGVTNPQAPLAVNGGVLASNSGVQLNQSCSAEGMIGYDMTTHQPVYCNGTPGTWASMNGGIVTYSLANPGYVKFANGFLIEWGAYSAIANATTVVNLPVPVTGYMEPLVVQSAQNNNMVARATVDNDSQFTANATCLGCIGNWSIPVTTWYWLVVGW